MANNEFKCDGLNELISYFEKYTDSAEFEKIEKRAIKEGANIVANSIRMSLKNASTKGYSKGYTIDELVVGNPRKTPTGYVCKIGWNGPHQRYRLAHLNEFGYSKNGKTYEPPMLGRVSEGIEQSRKNYFGSVKQTLEEGIEKNG